VSSAIAGEAGFVTETINSARLIRGDSVYSLEAGIALASEDIIETDADSHAQLEMQDGSVLEVGPSSQLYLSEYRLDQSKQVEKAEVSLIIGWLRFITAKLGPSRSYRFITPTMTIGIRGTEGVILAEDDNSSLSLNEGEIELSELDSEGRISRADRLLAGEYVARRQGQRLQRLREAPSAFRDQIPPLFRQRLVRKLKDLKRRGIKLKRLRQIDFRDMQKIIRTNPGIRDRLIERYKQRFEDPVFRKNFSEYLKNNPGLRNRLKNNPFLKEKMKQRAVKQRKRQLREKKQGQTRENIRRDSYQRKRR